ncbi:MAG: hypothetical protein R3C20_03210 [Planctomycetaceae bacterium]
MCQFIGNSLQHPTWPSAPGESWESLDLKCGKQGIWNTEARKWRMVPKDRDILYRDYNQCVFICDGSHHNPLLPKPLQAGSHLVQKLLSPAVDGTQVVTQKVDVLVSFSSLGLSTFAKVLTSGTNSLMDRNLFEVSLYASLMSRAVRDEPNGSFRWLSRWTVYCHNEAGELMAIARQPRIVPADSRAVSAEKSRDDRKQLLSL